MPDESGGVDVGGDGSVAWKTFVGCVRKGSVVSRPVGAAGYLQGGVDETDPGGSFAIGIKVPRENGGTLAQALFEAAKDAEAHAGEPGYRVKFPLLIEPKNEDQITIRWESATPPKSSGVRKRSQALAKKKPVKKASKAAPRKPAKKKAGKKR